MQDPEDQRLIALGTDMYRDTYTWDVFLSCRRRGEWPGWIKKHFLPLLDHHLGEVLDPPAPRIYWDENDLEAGPDYPPVLAEALTRSAVLVPLLSKQYLGSRYCQTEFQLMYQRELACGYRKIAKTRVLIVPVIVHDGEKFPEEVRRWKACRSVTSPIRAWNIMAHSRRDSPT